MKKPSFFEIDLDHQLSISATMLFPRMDVGQNFFGNKYYGMWTMSTPTMLISPVKYAENAKADQYRSTLWSSPSNITVFPSPAKPTKSSERASTFRKHIQFPDSPPKKLFRPWIDEQDDADDDDKSSPPINISQDPSSASSSRFRDQNQSFTTFNKVQQLADTLTAVQEDDDETSKTTLELIATNLGKSIEGHRCIYCGKIYSRKYGLKIHLRTHTGFKPLKCKICHRPFGDPSNLNKHTRLHAESGAPLFQCHLCGKTLVRKRDLERHLNSRHPDDVEIDVERL